MALSNVVGADIDPIDVRATRLQLFTHCFMYALQLCRRYQATGDPALIGDDQNQVSGAIQSGNGCGHIGEKKELIPALDVVVFCCLAIDHTIPI